MADERPRAVILARGGTGRELRHWLVEHFDVVGFLDDNDTSRDVIGTIPSWVELPAETWLVSALGSYRSMNRRREILRTIPDDRSPCVVSRSATSYQPLAAVGLVVFPSAIVSCDVAIGKHVLIYHGALLSHDVRVGDFSMISNAVTISGNCTIGENCYLGAGATILDGVRIGDDSIVAAGATVVEDVPSATIYIAPGKTAANHYLGR